MLSRAMLPVVGVCLALVVSGCYESPDAVIHEPGVYKGKRDELLSKEASPQQQQALHKRFMMVQTDR